MKLSKRAKLFLANGVFFIVLLVVIVIHFMMDDLMVYVYMLAYILALCGFVMFSLIVYYLSIIADAIGKRYKDRMADETKKPENK